MLKLSCSLPTFNADPDPDLDPTLHYTKDNSEARKITHAKVERLSSPTAGQEEIAALPQLRSPLCNVLVESACVCEAKHAKFPVTLVDEWQPVLMVRTRDHYLNVFVLHQGLKGADANTALKELLPSFAVAHTKKGKI